MKKPVSIILSVLLIAAVAVAAVFGVQKNDANKEAAQLQADLTASQTKTSELESTIATQNTQALRSRS